MENKSKKRPGKAQLKKLIFRTALPNNWEIIFIVLYFLTLIETRMTDFLTDFLVFRNEFWAADRSMKDKVLAENKIMCKIVSWRCRGSNPGPFTCKANALPLRYNPTCDARAEKICSEIDCFVHCSGMSCACVHGVLWLLNQGTRSLAEQSEVFPAASQTLMHAVDYPAVFRKNVKRKRKKTEYSK